MVGLQCRADEVRTLVSAHAALLILELDESWYTDVGTIIVRSGAMERGGAFRGVYHVLGGVLSALDGIGPDNLRIPTLLTRVRTEGCREVILALNATIDGQTTAHYIADALEGSGAAITSLAKGVPIGGELDYLDDGTIGAALGARRSLRT